MGTVYEAEQLEPVRRRVALKIVKLGMDTQEVVARFMTERQALAAMDHPFVAKVFDAGQTAAGRPYFVMELVEGVPLLELLRCASALARRASRTVHPDLPRRAARPSEGCGAPRSQAIQRPGDVRPRRTRRRRSSTSASPRRSAAIGPGASLESRAPISPGNTCLHEPRTGRVRPARCRYPNRRLFAWA